MWLWIQNSVTKWFIRVALKNWFIFTHKHGPGYLGGTLILGTIKGFKKIILTGRQESKLNNLYLPSPEVKIVWNIIDMSFIHICPMTTNQLGKIILQIWNKSLTFPVFQETYMFWPDEPVEFVVTDAKCKFGIKNIEFRSICFIRP